MGESFLTCWILSIDGQAICFYQSSVGYLFIVWVFCDTEWCPAVVWNEPCGPAVSLLCSWDTLAHRHLSLIWKYPSPPESLAHDWQSWLLLGLTLREKTSGGVGGWESCCVCCYGNYFKLDCARKYQSLFLIVCVSWTQTLLNIVTVWEQEGVWERITSSVQLYSVWSGHTGNET